MGAISKHSAQAYRPGTVIVGGSFGFTNTTGAPANVRGSGFTVAKLDVGRYTVTFGEAFREAESIVASASPTSTNEFTAYAGAYDAATGSFVLNVYDTTAQAFGDFSAASGRVNFVAVMRTRSIGGA